MSRSRTRLRRGSCRGDSLAGWTRQEGQPVGRTAPLPTPRVASTKGSKALAKMSAVVVTVVIGRDPLAAAAAVVVVVVATAEEEKGAIAMDA